MSLIKSQKIVYRILVPYLVLFVVMVCLIIDGTTSYLGKRLESLLKVEAGNSHAHALSFLEHGNQHFIESMRKSAASPQLAEALSKGDNSLAWNVMRQFHVDGKHDYIRIVDADGHAVAERNGKADKPGPLFIDQAAAVLASGKEKRKLVVSSEGLGVWAMLPIIDKGRYVGGVLAYHRWTNGECRVLAQQTGSEIFIFDNERLLVSSVHIGTDGRQPHIPAEKIERVLSSGERLNEHIFANGKEYAAVLAPLYDFDDNIVAMLVAAKDTTLVDAVLYGVIKTAFGYSLLGLAVVVFIAFLIARGISAPVLKLAGVTSRVAAGDLNARAEIDSQDEIGQLAEAFDSMTADLQATRSELVAANELSENIVRSVSEALIILGSDGFVISINLAASKLLGYSVDEIAGRHVEVMIAQENPSGFIQDLLAEIISGQSVSERDIVFRARNGENIHMSASGSSVKSEGGFSLAIVLSARDMRDSRLVAELNVANELLRHEVEERLRIEERLRASEKKYRAIFELATEGIVVAGQDDNGIYYANSAIGKLLGFAIDELLTMKTVDISPALNMAGEISGAEVSRTISCRRRDGAILSIQIGSVCMNLDGKPCRVFFFCDVTEQARINEALGKAKQDAETANRAKTAFLAKVSHEFRTPMNGILGFTNMLLDSNLDAKQQRYAGFVKRSADALLDLVDDVLDYVKVETEKLSLDSHDFMLREVLGEELGFYERNAREKGLGFSWLIDDDAPECLRGDAKRLRQIVGRLVENGIRFTDDGEVKINLAVKEKNARTVLLHFSVHDTGAGVPVSEQEAIFQSFTQVEDYYTRAHGGLGLGLAISKHLVGLMGGELWLESRSDQEDGSASGATGSVFHFTARFELISER